MIAALLLSLSPAAPAPHALPSAGPLSAGLRQQAAQDTAELPDFKSILDRSIRWLRSEQDLSTGLYGGSLDATADVLHAMAVSPRAYRRADGPFVALALDALLAAQEEDGSFGDLEKTRRIVATLTHFAEPEQRDALARGLRNLASQGIDDPAFGKTFTGDRGEAARSSMRIVAGLDERGSVGGDVRATAAAVVELSHHAALLAPPKKSRDARALPVFSAADQEAASTSILKGARFLISQAQDGLWGAPGQPDAGITAMVTGALCAVPAPRPADVQETIDGALAWLVGLQNEDGSIHDGKLANYNTSAAILALARSGDPRHAGVITRARDFLVGLQADEGEGYSTDHHYYGGIGYGGDERPDLSNLQMALEALSVSGLESDHEAFQRAMVFLQRCQNRSESNDVSLAEGGVVMVSGDDGGGTYMPGNSKAGSLELADGTAVARSYGSMSYALLKGYVFAGLERDDPRVQALWDWLQANYTLDVNPGFEFASNPTAAYQGLFYYFHTMAKALDLYGVDTITDGEGVQHAWRSELAGRVISMQSRIDGSWINENAPRWWEGNPLLATSYAMLTLDSAAPE